jgi:Spy/CpxP family protein refolding chaperone
MNSSTDSSGPNIPAPRSLFNRVTLIAFIAGASLAGSVVALAAGNGMGACHHGMMMDGTQSPDEVSAHVDHMLKHLYVELDATDAQKAQIGPLVKQAMNDLMPLHKQLHAAHAQMIDALTQPTIDRAALETARVAHLQLADQASKRFVQLVADVGDVLTPAQRTALAYHLKRTHGMHGMGGAGMVGP